MGGGGGGALGFLTGGLGGAVEGGDQALKQSADDDAADAAAARLNQLKQEQATQIADFDKNAPGLGASTINNQDEATRDALMNRMQGIRANASSRGLLHSGLESSAEAQSNLGAAQQFASTRANVNSAIALARQRMQTLYDNMRYNSAESDILMADHVYDSALQDAMADQGVVGNLMGAFGAGAGVLAASQSRASAPSASAASSGSGGTPYYYTMPK